MNQKKIVLPLTILLRILYFVLSYLIICVGIALSNRCKLPIIQTDLFPLEVADITGKPYARIKIGFDLSACHGVHDVLFPRTYPGARSRHDRSGIYNGKGHCDRRKPDRP